MPSFIKGSINALLWLAGLLAVAVFGLAIFLTTLDANDYKDWLAGKVLDESGRTLVLGGDIGLSFYPWLGLEASGVRLGNAPGFGAAPFLSVDYVKLRIKTVPLLRGRYEVDTVTIKGAAINLVKNSQGVSNWDDLFAEEAAGEAADERSTSRPLAAVALGGVDIKDAMVSWRDEQTGTQATIKALTISTAALRYGEPIDLALSFQATANKPALDTHVSLAGVFNYDADAERYSLAPLNLTAALHGQNIPGGRTTATLDSAGIMVDLGADTVTLAESSVRALGASITASLAAGEVSTDNPQLALELSAAGSDIATFFKILEIQPLADQLARLADRSFSLETVLNADGGDIAVPRFKAALLGADIDAAFTAENTLSKKPAYRGRLTARGPDLPAVMQLLGQLRGGGDELLSIYGRRLANAPAKAFVLDAAFNADMGSGELAASTLAIDALGVSVRGGLDSKDLRDKDGSLMGSLEVKAEQPAALLAAVGRPELAKVLQSIRFETRLAGDAGSVAFSPLRAEAVLAGQELPGSPVTLSLTAAESAIALHDGHLAPTALRLDGLRLSGLGVALSANIKAENIDEAAEFEGELKLLPMNLRRLARQLGWPLPPMADSTTLQNIAFSSRFAGRPNQLNLADLSLQLDETTVQGRLSATSDASASSAGQDALAYTFDLDIDQLDLDRYLPPKSPAAGDAAADKQADDRAIKQANATPVAALRRLTMQGELALGELKLSNVNLANIALSVSAADGLIAFKPITAQLYQGTYRGDVSVDMRGALPRLAINSTLSGVRTESLLDDALGSAGIHGIGDLGLALAASGLDAATIRRSLSGSGSLALREGLFIGVNVPQVLRQVEIMLESKRFAAIDKGRQTEFDSLTGSFDIAGGVVSNDDLLMRGNGFEVTGEGVLANLVDASWDYDLNVAVTAGRAARGEETFNTGGYDIPIACRGQLADRNCKPDIAHIAKTAAKKAVENVLEKAIIDKILPKDKQGLEPARELLKKIF